MNILPYHRKNKTKSESTRKKNMIKLAKLLFGLSYLSLSSKTENISIRSLWEFSHWDLHHCIWIKWFRKKKKEIDLKSLSLVFGIEGIHKAMISKDLVEELLSFQFFKKWWNFTRFGFHWSRCQVTTSFPILHLFLYLLTNYYVYSYL